MKTESFKTLEVGRKYLSRVGKVVEIKLDDGYSCFPFNGDNGESYTIEGRVWMQSVSDRDLISRIVSATLTMQRWGVLIKAEECFLIGNFATRLPYTFKTRKDARRFVALDPGKLKTIKIRCTFEVIE